MEDRRPDQSQLRAIEAWFVTRGLPHFVERRPSIWEIWGRAIPLLVVAYVLLGLNALDLAEWTWIGNVLAAVFVVAVLVLTWIGANMIRGRSPLQRPDTIGPVELALLILAPAVPSAVFGQWGDAAQTVLEGAVVLLAVWALTSYGVLPLFAWALRSTSSQLPAFLNLIVRALPLLLLFMTFLFVNAEVWEVAGTLSGPIYVVVLAVFFVLGNVFLLSRLPALMRAQNTFASWAEVIDLVDDAAVVADDFVRRVAGDTDDVPAVDRPSTRQRLNIGLVAVFSQAIQITATAVAMFGFFVLFGFLAISADIAAGWTGATVHVLADVTVGGRTLVVSEPLLRVAGFLGTFAGMYFTVVLSTDSTYREEFTEDIGPELRRALAVRVLYRRALWGVMMVGEQRRAGVTDDEQLDDDGDDIEIRVVDSPADLRRLVVLLNQVWGTMTPLIGVELLRALGHAGGYVAGAFSDSRMVGGSLGFLGRHDGELVLHSHVTGILPGVRQTGLGRQMKLHQREWAASQGLDTIVWTFDPLVRRNAWFNLGVLGATVDAYLVDFYGQMVDSVNGRDPSDRLLVAWPTSGPLPAPDQVRPVPPGAIAVPTPEDIVVLRRTDPGAASAWRLRLREELGTPLTQGAAVVGFTRDGDYLVLPEPEP